MSNKLTIKLGDGTHFIDWDTFRKEQEWYQERERQVEKDPQFRKMMTGVLKRMLAHMEQGERDLPKHIATQIYKVSTCLSKKL